MADRSQSPPASRLLVPAGAGVLVALTVGLLARAEAIAPGTYPGGYFQLFFSDPVHLKIWFATAALALSTLQPLGAAWLFGKLPWRTPPWIAGFHRWNGRLVFVVVLPVAYLCVFRIGFQDTSGRVLTHALLGCTFYGAFAAKVLVVRMRGLPTWTLVVAGGLLFALLLATWYTSALWMLRMLGLGL
jgi:hypothetical protein